MKITFDSPKDITVVQEMKKTFESLTIYSLQDFPDQKLVHANTIEMGVIVLWKDAEYDAIGQWTDTDVINRINELYAQN